MKTYFQLSNQLHVIVAHYPKWKSIWQDLDAKYRTYFEANGDQKKPDPSLTPEIAEFERQEVSACHVVDSITFYEENESKQAEVKNFTLGNAEVQALARAIAEINSIKTTKTVKEALEDYWY